MKRNSTIWQKYLLRYQNWLRSYNHCRLPLILILALWLIGFSSFTLGNESLRIIGVIRGIVIILISSAQINSILQKQTIATDMHKKHSDNDVTLSLLKKFARSIKDQFVRILIKCLYLHDNSYWDWHTLQTHN